MSKKQTNFNELVGGAKIFTATPTKEGLMSPADKKKLDQLSEGIGDYSAFEVYAHDTEIPVGELTAPHLDYIGQPGDIISQAVPASMTHRFIIRSEIQQSEQTTVVDWGDGVVTKLSDIVPQYLTDAKEYRFTAEHIYAKNGTYIVKIIGKDYFSFIYGGDETKNLLCRIFDTDLPIAPWIWNVSGICRQAQRLLRVNFHSHSVGIQATNWSNAFLGDRNLLTVYGFTGYNNHYTVATQIFTNARALTGTDFTLCPYPRTLAANSGCFIKCDKLAVDINKLIPVNGFKSGSTIDLAQVFWGCSNISGTVPADLLWNDTTITWVNTGQAFADCSAEIRAQVPVSWGGTAPDSIIKAANENSIEFSAAPVSTDGNITLDAASNLYTVKPSAAVTVVLDAAAVGSSRFVLALDFSGGVQTVTMPENFRWNGDAPNMSLKGIHTVDVVYMATDKVNAFTGTYLGRVANPIDPNKGVVTYLNGQLKEDWCGDEFNNLAVSAGGWDDDGNQLEEAVVVNVNPGGYIHGQLSIQYPNIDSDVTVNIQGGQVARIESFNGDGVIQINVLSGKVENLYMDGASGSNGFRMSGGTISNLSFSEMSGDAINISNGVIDKISLWYIYVKDATISGGTIGRCDLSESGDLCVSGGTIGTISLNGPSIMVTVSGGYVGLIDSTSEAYDGDIIKLSGCTIGRLQAYDVADYDPNVTIGDNVTIGELRMHQYSNNMDGVPFAPNIGKNCRIDRLSFTHDFDVIEDVSSFSFSVGANSVVKLDKTMQELITANVLTINADSTAQIINLED